jgi:phosphonate transport system substrate-binding protein
MPKRRSMLLLAATIALAATIGVVATTAAAQPAPLAFGVLNQQSPALTAERWNPILHYVGTASGVPLRLRMGRTVQETDDMMGRGELDFVFTNHNFQSEYERVGYRVIARWGGEPIRGVIVVAAASPVRQLSDLAGKRMAFPSRDAFVAYAVPLVALKTVGVTVEEVLAGNQDGALAQLKAQQVEAAAVNSRFLKQYVEREAVAFREIYVSDPYPDLAVIAHPRVPAATVNAVRKALLGMKNEPVAAAVLERVKFVGFDPATNQDYEGMRRIYRRIGQ